MKRTKKKPNTINSRKRVSRKRVSRKRVSRKINKSIKKIGGSDGDEGGGFDWREWMNWALLKANQGLGNFALSYTRDNPVREAAMINNNVDLSGQFGGKIRSNKRKIR